MTASLTAATLERVARPLRRWSAVRWALAFLATMALLFSLAAWGLRAALGAPASLVLGAWTLSALGFAVLLVVAFRERRRYQAAAMGRRLEGLGVGRRGSLVALLDPTASGTSDELVAAADVARAERVAAEGGGALAPARERLRLASAAFAALLLVGAAGLAAARPGRGATILLWRPLHALEALRAPVRLGADRTEVERGSPVRLRYDAPGQRSATLWRRAPGEPWTAEPVSLDSTGSGRTLLESVETDLFLHLTSGTRSSDTLRIAVRLPVFLGSLRLTARYPAYLDLEDEVLPVGSDPLLLPEGTVLSTEGVLSAALAGAAWRTAELEYPLTTREREFRGELRPVRSGDYDLALVTRDGRALTGDPVRLTLVIVPDSVPSILLLHPGADTVAPPDLRLPLLADARDDHGLTSVRLISRRTVRGGQAPAPRIEELPMPEVTSSRLLVTTLLDLSPWEAGPGDTVLYRLEVVDNALARQVARSGEFAVVIPTRADERAAERAMTADARSALDSLVGASRSLERQASDLAQERPRQEAGRDRREGALGFEEARRAEAVAAGQEDMLRRGEELERTLDALREAMETSGTADSALARRLEAVSEQLGRALSPELREKLAELQRALQALAPEQVRDALRQLAEAQQELREALERSRELFERAALEGELSTLEQDAKDVAQAQRELNQRMAVGDSSGLAGREEQLAGQADSIGAGLERAGRQLDREQLAEAAERARQAAQQMRAASGAIQQGRRQQAMQQGQQAQAGMEDVARETGEQRDRQQDAWRQEVMQALDRALAETARLSRQQLEVAEGFRSGRSPASGRGDQAAVEEGLQKVLEQVRRVSGQNALVSPAIGVALALAGRQMASARDAVSSGNPNVREAAEQAGNAVDALNAAAYAMARSRENVGGASSGSGMAEAMEQMTELAQQQGQLGQQAGQLMPLAGAGSARAEIQRLAAEQRSLGEALERLRAQGDLPGARDLAQEAHELARRLDAGRLDRETVERQERLFRRMLDAGRTLQGEETDEQKERQSTTAMGDRVRLPPALGRLPRDRVRVPTWEELRTLSPEERRLVTEYFRRLAGGSP